MGRQAIAEGDGGAPTQRASCVNCMGKHPAWSRSCPERVKWIARAKDAWAERPRYFVSPDYSKRTEQQHQGATADLPQGAPEPKRKHTTTAAARMAPAIRPRGRPPSSAPIGDTGSRNITDMFAALSQPVRNQIMDLDL